MSRNRKTHNVQVEPYTRDDMLLIPLSGNLLKAVEARMGCKLPMQPSGFVGDELLENEASTSYCAKNDIRK
jgi:hypothetical protein